MEPQTVKEFFRVICDDKLEFVQYEKFNRLCDLFFYAPGLVFKRKNDSENLYLIMSSMAHKTAFIMQEKVRKDKMPKEEKDRMVLVEKFWQRLQQKFIKLNETFRFFDRNFDNQISFKEFRVVCEELDLRMSHE